MAKSKPKAKPQPSLSLPTELVYQHPLIIHASNLPADPVTIDVRDAHGPVSSRDAHVHDDGELGTFGGRGFPVYLPRTGMWTVTVTPSTGAPLVGKVQVR